MEAHGRHRRAHHRCERVELGAVLSCAVKRQNSPLRHHVPRPLDVPARSWRTRHKTTSSARRSYLSSDNVQTLAVSDERSDTGFFNVAFDKALQTVNEMRYATAHGYQSQVFAGSHMALYPEQKHLETLRPFTAIAAAAMGDQKFGRVITQALTPTTPGRLSRSERYAFEWDWLPTKGTVPKGGLIAVSGDVNFGQMWWFVFTDGPYFSADGGTTLAKVLDEKGGAAK